MPNTPAYTFPSEAVSSACSFLRTEYGDHGYSIATWISLGSIYVFVARHSDGSEFFIVSDRWGNCASADDVDEAVRRHAARMLERSTSAAD